MSEIEISGSIVKDARTIADAFNTYFQSVFTRTQPSCSSLSSNEGRMPDITMSESGIFQLLLPLDAKKSHGSDEISNTYLKRYAGLLSPFPQKLFSLSLERAMLPDDWLCANVIPIHKSRSKQLINN